MPDSELLLHRDRNSIRFDLRSAGDVVLYHLSSSDRELRDALMA
ncbi:hypothetical protein EYZ11_012189 [Aspergillus tanneri]|uniref:Uncharacterized protein n=1 Tax=Aspergillus tanneri TaxID=1220188 RepID=A0A4S3J304_9EURO|nr:hypothetical protein EYZ11_012189 [Aspergillus tanneri]